MKIKTFLSLTLILLNGIAIAGNFTDNENGTVTDSDTGLIWQKEDDDTTRTWETAITYCEGLSLAEYNDWRLPNIKENEPPRSKLRSILNSKQFQLLLIQHLIISIALIPYIILKCSFVTMLTYTTSKISFTPKFSSP